MTELPPQCDGNYYLKTSEVAKLMRKTMNGMYKMIQMGTVPNHLRVGKHILWRCTDVVEWIEQYPEYLGPPPRRKPKMSESAEPEEPEDTADEDEEEAS